MTLSGFLGGMDHSATPGQQPEVVYSPLEAIFVEEPVSLDTFVTDSLYMNNPPLGHYQYDAVRHIERILRPETFALMGGTWPYWREDVRMTNLITLQWGK